MIILTCSFKPQPVSSIPSHHFIVLSKRCLSVKHSPHLTSTHAALATTIPPKPSSMKHSSAQPCAPEPGRQAGQVTDPPSVAVHLVFFSVPAHTIQRPASYRNRQHPTTKSSDAPARSDRGRRPIGQRQVVLYRTHRRPRRASDRCHRLSRGLGVGRRPPGLGEQQLVLVGTELPCARVPGPVPGGRSQQRREGERKG